ncbi:hypothetical protein G0Q06_06720 [Puniceicoccales bacterium CK1056]|uniref:Uncharacterized protein n=1 Tax=Oceanipulchritudo coccoides TaxID=2706888 RepID=A0A6B2M1X1_9BACT|nr:hypothetical protein [Oceanipulchritudo coccoides]NDV62134.1 hypothetical protein [Oceanipulchritudo coccoides]
MKQILALILTVMLPMGLLASFDLKDELGRKTFEASGLDKLSKEELATLNAAVSGLLGKQEEVLRAENSLPQGEDRFGLETVKSRVRDLFQASGPETIESSISGEFSGWSGKTLFKLDNGQVWRQTNAKTFVVKVNDPKVFIRRGVFGGYLLKIEGYNSSVKVERIK